MKSSSGSTPIGHLVLAGLVGIVGTFAVLRYVGVVEKVIFYDDESSDEEASLRKRQKRKKKRERKKEKKRTKKPLIGVIGGLGPRATAYFYDENILNARVKLYQVMNECFEEGESPEECLTKVQKISTADWTVEELEKVWENRASREKFRDQDHIPLLIYSNPTIPGRPEFMSGQSSDDPTPAMAETAQVLARSGATALCMVCSTAHYFKEGMLKGIDVPFLDMIELTFEYIGRSVSEDKKGDRMIVGLMGTSPLLEYKVYESALGKRPDLNVKIVTPLDLGAQEYFTQAIFGPEGVKSGFDSDLSCESTFKNFELLLIQVLKLKRAGAEAIILGCTELPLLLTEENIAQFGRRIRGGPDYSKDDLHNLLLVNPAQVLGDTLTRLLLI